MKKKPLLRGHFHQGAFFAALGAGLMLVFGAHGFEKRISALVYFISLAGLYGISAVYHRPVWKENIRRWLKRIDHSAIFILIGGTATPLCVLGVQGEAGTKLLWLIWTGAIIGILQAIFWIGAPRWLTAAIYISVGLLAAPYIPELYQSLSTTDFILILVGGGIYAIGAVIYAIKRPAPNARIFGYHELFHILVILASISHFIVIYRLVMPNVA